MGSASGRIVVGVDGSAGSVAALRMAARLAPAFETGIHAVVCWHFPRIYEGYVPPDFEAFEASAKKKLEAALEQAFGDEPPADLTTELVRGPAPEMLVEAGAEAVMLVVGRRGHGGLRGMHLGSVSTACVSHAACPVLVLHEDGKVHSRRGHRHEREHG
ncbi:UspA domain-containing protein [Arthrobacter crystallopoietes BAB-32]|uniref:UspA domain-containing protein n=1 Tax=Arthrobacter crystallopoietes BAB-32 TaxID=1246476 RepID=N1UVG8_9MICC|nr:universal stress protein [Arthrobacter crystallopoietes]EMY34396.1 UspA domain-containing protein [Arthrobacter crystallopoietes BAB-32]